MPEIELHYKKKIKSSQLVRITSSETAHTILRSIWSPRIELCEEFVILILNRSHKCLGWVKISQGGVTGTIVDSKIILAVAIKALASAIIICHNHPSGQLKPSASDIQLTKKLKECCQLFEIELCDHIILSGDTEEYYSFADNGIPY